jgi:hypothetical protein
VLGGLAGGDQFIVHPSDKISDGIAIDPRHEHGQESAAEGRGV